MQNERLELNRKLITSKCNLLKLELIENSKNINQINNKITALNFDIEQKEESEKVEKKIRVVEFF
ncbi:hypothetical protein GCM10027592_46980 [Spirosoma flavus]